MALNYMHMNYTIYTFVPVLIHNSPPLTINTTVPIPAPASVGSTIWYSPALLLLVLFRVSLRQSLENVYLELLVQERLTVPPLPINTQWIPSTVTGGMGSFITVKEMVTGSPTSNSLLVTLSEGATSGSTTKYNCTAFKTHFYNPNCIRL